MVPSNQQTAPIARLLRGYLFVIASAVIFGCMPLVARYIYANGVNPISLVFYRNCLSVPVLFLLVKKSGESLKVSPRDLMKLIVLSLLGSVLTPTLLYSSYNYIPSGTSTTLHFIYPAAVILGETIFCKVRLQLRQVLCVALCLLGVGMFYVPGGDLDPVGSALAIPSGITYAAYVILLSQFHLEHISGFKYSLYLSSICSLVMPFICIPTGNFTVPTNLNCWIVCFIFSLFLCIGAVVLFRKGTLLIGGQRASILSTFEPITSIFIGIVLFCEPFGWRTAVGSILIILATVLIAVFDTKQAKASSYPANQNPNKS